VFFSPFTLTLTRSPSPVRRVFSFDFFGLFCVSHPYPFDLFTKAHVPDLCAISGRGEFLWLFLFLWLVILKAARMRGFRVPIPDIPLIPVFRMTYMCVGVRLLFARMCSFYYMRE
jgi:hypothetical protein